MKSQEYTMSVVKIVMKFILGKQEGPSERGVKSTCVTFIYRKTLNTIQ